MVGRTALERPDGGEAPGRQGHEEQGCICPCPFRKGIDEKRFSVDMVVEDVLWLGYSKVLLKSDNEPAIVKLLKESLATLKVSGVDQAG